MSPAFAGLYEGAPPHSRPKIDATWTITPLLRSFMEGMTRRVMVTAERRFAASTASQSSLPASIPGFPRDPPIRVTRTSIRPNLSIAGVSRAGSARLDLEDVVPDLLGIGRVRLQVEIALERRQRLVLLPVLVAQDADGAVGVGVARIETRRQLVLVEGLVELLVAGGPVLRLGHPFFGDLTEKIVGDRIVRRQVQDLLDLRFGISETPEPDVLHRVVARQDPHTHLELARIGGGTPRLPDAAVARRQKLLHVGDPLVQARVAAEEEDLHLAVVAAIVLENLEDARTLPRVVAGRHCPLQADLVRLALQLAAEAVDRRDEGELQPQAQQDVADLVDHVRIPPVALLGSRPGLPRDPDARGDGGDRKADRLVAGAALELESVAVGGGRHLMAEDDRELGFVFEARQEPRVHVDRAGRKGEGVERRVLDREHPEPDRLLPLHLGRRQAIGHLVQIVLENRILVERGLVAQLALFLPRLVPQTTLVACRLEGGALGADRRHARRQAAGLAREKRGDDDDGGKGSNVFERLRAGGGL